ncbi:MAG TPA: glycosyltransferase family 39 protein, partial [Chthonomonadaceae bacterium]|nr:glycosyltransferase family 39 protein [Chthonomonadaceae bacterium]
MKALLYSNPAVRRWLVMNVLACSVLVGFALRLLLAQRSGLWRDEGLFLFIVRFPTLRDIFHFLHYHESHPPLFYLLMRGWQAVFGPSDAAALALPLLLGALFPIAVFLVGRVLFGLRAALLATVFACVSPGLCAYSAQVRPYSLLPLLCLLSVFFVWQALQGQGKGAWGWYTLVT